MQIYAFQAYLIYLEKNRQIVLISLIGMAAGLSLNTVRVINYGAEGAAISSVIPYSLMALMCYLLVRKYFFVKKN